MESVEFAVFQFSWISRLPYTHTFKTAIYWSESTRNYIPMNLWKIGDWRKLVHANLNESRAQYVIKSTHEIFVNKKKYAAFVKIIKQSFNLTFFAQFRHIKCSLVCLCFADEELLYQSGLKLCKIVRHIESWEFFFRSMGHYKELGY